MNPHRQCCHTPQCRARGQVGQGNMRVHSQAARRYQGTTCRRTFAATKGTPFSRLRTAGDLVTLVRTLRCHGCPLQAIVAACGLDERTVAAWGARAGHHCRQGPQHVVQQGRVDLQHVQAEALWVKLVGRRGWRAMALAVPSRLWLGGLSSPQRARALITALVQMGRSCASTLAILVCGDGLARSLTAGLRGFRQPVRTGRRGRPRLVLESGVLLGQVVKRYVRRRVVSVERRVVRGTAKAIVARLAISGGGTGRNTADLERLNATLRSTLAPLVRRGRALAHKEAVLTAGMSLVGGADTCCWRHGSLRVAAPPGAPWKGQERTPAMAAGLPDHRWTRRERLRYQVPLSTGVEPKRRGRPPQRGQPPLVAIAV